MKLRFTLKGLLLAIVPVFLLLYMLAGFVLVPMAIKNYLTGSLAEKSGLVVQVESVSLNPFSLRLDIHQLAISDTHAQKLLGFEQFGVDINALSLPGSMISVETVILQNPYFLMAIDEQGKLLVVEKLAKVFAGDQPAAENSPLPAFAIRQLDIAIGRIDISTNQSGKPFRQTLLLDKLSIIDLHTTEAGHANRLMASISTPDKAVLHIDSTLDLAGNKVAGLFKLKDFNLQPLLAAMPLPFDIHLAPMPLDITTSFAVDYSKTTRLALENADVQLRTIKVSQTEKSPVLIDLPLLHITGIKLDLPKQQLTLQKVALPDGQVQLAIDKQGKANLQALFAVKTPGATASPSAGKPWDVRVESLLLSNHRLQLHSETTATPVDIVLAPLSVSLSHWQPLDNSQKFPLQLSTGLPDAGLVDVIADVQLEPLHISGKASLKALALPLLQPLANELSLLDIRKGVAGSDVVFSVTKLPEQDHVQVQAEGNLHVNDFRVRKQNSMKKLLSWKTLSVSAFSYQLPANSLNIASVDINQSYGRFIIGQDGISNLQGLLKQASPAAASGNTGAGAGAGAGAAVKPLQWHIGKVNVVEGDMGFSDLSLQPAFRTAIKSLNGTVSNISSKPGVLAKIDLKGKVDKYAPVSIAGDFSLSMEKPQLDMVMDFRNIELNSFTPYSGIYAGHAIDRGQVSMELKYQLENRRIKGVNHIVVNQLTLGKKVESDKVIDLPLKLALALLTDDNGVIDLGFEIQGDITDPEFSLNDIIFKALKEMLKKTVTAPFKYLRGVFKVEKKNVQRIAFIPGTDKADAAIDEKLAAVAAYLQSKKALMLNVQGNVLPEVDRPALQEQELLQILSLESRQKADLFLPSANAAEDKELMSIVAEYYQQQRNESFSRLENRLQAELSAAGTVPDPVHLRRQAYALAWQKLVETRPVTDDDLYNLAQNRAQQIKVTLVEKFKVDAGRIFLLDSQSSSAEPSLDSRLFVDVR